MIMLHKTDKEIIEGVSPAMARRVIFLEEQRNRAQEAAQKGANKGFG